VPSIFCGIPIPTPCTPNTHKNNHATKKIQISYIISNIIVKHFQKKFSKWTATNSETGNYSVITAGSTTTGKRSAESGNRRINPALMCKD
jgi:hypothetical protein